MTRQAGDEADVEIGRQVGNKAGMQDRASGLEQNKIIDCQYILKRVNTKRSLVNRSNVPSQAIEVLEVVKAFLF